MSALALAGDASVRRSHDLTHLSDTELLSGTRRLVGASNQLLAELLAHLGEVEARGIHRAKACASLYTYCIYELRFSEDAAFRRVSAARWVRKFPLLFDAVASGELHLTGVLMLAPHLTSTNCRHVLARAKHRTKKELVKLVRELDPLPDVPARVAPLGPEPPQRVPVRNPTWAEYVASMVPVRDLSPGDRPRDWIDESTLTSALEQAAVVTVDDAAPARDSDTRSTNAARTGQIAGFSARIGAPLMGPQRYSVQFTASQAYVELLERARALLSHAREGASLEEIHLRALQLLVARLEDKRYGARPKGAQNASDPNTTPIVDPAACAVQCTGKRINEDDPARSPMGESRADGRCDATSGHRSRHVPARIRRRVFERDGARCTFVDPSGVRCAELERLELHHLEPFANAGAHHADNLTLRCQAHNTLAAEQDFGRERILAKRDAAHHESMRSQRARPG